MPKPKAEIGERWLIKNLRGGRAGWRTIVSIHHDKKQGRLYGFRDYRCPEYPLGPVSAEPRGRFVRARYLVRRDKRTRSASINRESLAPDAPETGGASPPEFAYGYAAGLARIEGEGA